MSAPCAGDVKNLSNHTSHISGRASARDNGGVMYRAALYAVLVATCLSRLHAQSSTPPTGSRRVLAEPGRATAPSGDKASLASGSARLVGRVFAADTSLPVRFAQLRLTGQTLTLTRIVTSDSGGRFEIAALPAGRYTLVAVKSGFVTLQFGQRRPFEPGTPVELSDGQTRDLEFPLPRGSVIAGRITDDSGEPVAHAVVSAARYVYARGGRRQIESTDVQDSTDDLGQFRLFGLMPGDYVVNAALASPARRDASNANGETTEGYAPTYYPGVASPADATALKVGLGQEVSAYFSLMAARLATISGVVTDSEGRPASGARVSIGPAGDGDSSAGGTQARADGSFSLGGVPPGDRVLRVRLDAHGASRETEMAMLPVTVVGGANVSGLSLATAPGATLSGTISFQGEAATQRHGLVVVPTPSDPRNAPGIVGPQSNGQVGPDGRFRLGGLFGNVTFDLAGPDASRWTITSITVNGREVLDRPASVDSADPGTMRVVVSDQVTDVSGSVSDARGMPRKDFVVVFLPSGLADGVLPTRFVRTARPSQEGRFRTQGLPASNYHVLALEALEDGREWDPDFQAWAREHGTIVRIEGGSQTSVALSF